MTVAAIDQGTTSTRALVVDASGQSKIARMIAHQQFYPKPGWVEHDPGELLDHIQQCIAACGKVSALGLANQGESCLAWDADTKKPVSPVIVWQDRRTQTAIEKLRARDAQSLVTEKAGLPLDPYFSASKLAWLVAQNPAANALHRRGKLRLGTTDAFFLDHLTGRFVTDITTASRTSLMNLQSGQWDNELCDLFGVPMDALPEIVTSTGEFGELAANGKSIPVTASIVDQQASLYGHGCRAPGDAKITFGSGAFALVLSGAQPCRSHQQQLLPTVAWQLSNRAPQYALDGGVYCAGSAINWAGSVGLFKSLDEINQFPRPYAVEREVVFVPALSGLACPHWDRRAAGLWIGLALDTSPQRMMQSVLEGIAFRAAEVLSAASDATALQDTLSIDGGVSANPYFCQFLANLLGKQVVVRKFSELTAFGAAQLASGGAIESQCPNQQKTHYQPTENLNHCIARFNQAINRSTQWLS